jgi:hypothetical protein
VGVVTPIEAAVLLTVCASFDNRKPDADAAKAWAIVLDGFHFEDCRDAVIQHYRSSREWIMPADITAAVRKIRTGRIEDVAPTPPADLDPDDTAAYARWLETTRRAIADGQPVEPEPYRPTRQLGELAGVFRSIPKGPLPLPAPKTAAHDEGMKRARAELDARREVPVPPPLDTPPLREPGPDPTPPQREHAAVATSDETKEAVA